MASLEGAIDAGIALHDVSQQGRRRNPLSPITNQKEWVAPGLVSKNAADTTAPSTVSEESNVNVSTPGTQYSAENQEKQGTSTAVAQFR